MSIKYVHGPSIAHLTVYHTFLRLRTILSAYVYETGFIRLVTTLDTPLTLPLYQLGNAS